MEIGRTIIETDARSWLSIGVESWLIRKLDGRLALADASAYIRRTVWSSCCPLSKYALPFLPADLVVEQVLPDPLRANDDETSSPREFSLEGAEG